MCSSGELNTLSNVHEKWNKVILVMVNFKTHLKILKTE